MDINETLAAHHNGAYRHPRRLEPVAAYELVIVAVDVVV